MKRFTMRVHVIVGCVVAGLLSSGLVSAVAARTTMGVAASDGNTAGPARPEIAELTRSIESLRARVAALEIEIARASAPHAAVAPTVQAPFTVVNGAGTPIFTVSDAAYADATKGRVHVGRGSSANYGLWFIASGGSIAAVLGESKTGPGTLVLSKGGKEAVSLTEDGFSYSATTGKTIAHLGPDPQNTARARLVVRGVLQITDANDVTMVDAGTLPDGRGTVRTWPNQECKSYGGLRSPQCLMGAAP
jgi:hypothetical protein